MTKNEKKIGIVFACSLIRILYYAVDSLYWKLSSTMDKLFSFRLMFNGFTLALKLLLEDISSLLLILLFSLI